MVGGRTKKERKHLGELKAREVMRGESTEDEGKRKYIHFPNAPPMG